ncbi:tumor necrosis factor ligand superfamily member 10 [Salmo salar]|uniref:Tumor necrosis factor ligand superfamily member 10 n=1 Tax=Salmo salar TaxID=8030 RepID=A0A1S3L205_SALSA|nr:tumor necrosis factor ligand superfamily member 10 [Salmo salar]|eukprot:XP_013984948.1 PREDICTED: tumor necrosis factor ligand superfamily member 10-like [Salmo salar]
MTKWVAPLIHQLYFMATRDQFRPVVEQRHIMAASNSRRDVQSKLWVPMIVIVVVVLQVASTTGLLIFLNMSVAQVRSQGVAEELRCLGLLNALEKDQEIPESLVELFGEPCIKLAQGIRAYVTKVTENIISKHAVPEPSAQPRTKPVSSAGHQKPSAHLTLRDSSLQGPISLASQKDLHQSCRHPVRSWGNQSFGSHLHNMTLSHGRLRIPRSGRYYLYAQVYFRYPSLTHEGGNHHGGTSSYQLVQCVYKKTSYARPLQLLKGVGTKCWAPDTEYALLSVYQGGLFELRAGDEIFVSVSSPTAVHAEDSSSYFGAFRFDP